MASPPVQDRLEAGDAVARQPGAGQLVALAGEQQQLDGLTNSQPMSLEPSKLSKALQARSLIAARNRSLWATSQDVM